LNDTFLADPAAFFEIGTFPCCPYAHTQIPSRQSPIGLEKSVVVTAKSIIGSLPSMYELWGKRNERILIFSFVAESSV